ncbi:MAG TPA: hypothetical protein VMX94_07995 [Armatimonadota bacterium]|nr:hypothetical protein [Armatimonadota bacterium]
MPREKSDAASPLLTYLPDLIGGIDPRILVLYLKEAGDLLPAVLSGFRATARTVGTPVVRQRLMREAERDPEFLETLGVLWIDSNKVLWSGIALSSAKELKDSLGELIREHSLPAVRIALLLDDRRSVRSLADKLELVAASETYRPAREKPKREMAGAKQPPRSDQAVERLSAENHRLKGKVRDLEGQVRGAERVLEQRRHEVERGRSVAQSLKQQLADQRQQLVKAEKTSDRLSRAKEAAEKGKSLAERELKQVRKQIRSSRTQSAATQRAPKASTWPQSPDWLPVILRMLKDGSYQAARVFCETLKGSEPESLHAHLALEHVYAKTGVRDKQADECFWIANHLSEKGEAARACAFVCRALEIDPAHQDSQIQFEQVLAKVRTSDESTISAIRSVLIKLKLSSPPAYQGACRIVRRMGRQYSRALESQPRVLHVDKILDLSYGRKSVQMSVRRILEAVDGNDVAVVAFVRSALANVRASKPALYRSVMESLEAQDRSCAAAIIRGTEPVVVDGSNVAWHEIKEKPRLQNILDLRSELRSEGYFPVYIYVDAALPYQVDQRSALQGLIDLGAVVAVDSRTDADEAIVEQARRLSCPVVTNDRMSDWDPEGEIPKVRFAIDRFGVTIYDR